MTTTTVNLVIDCREAALIARCREAVARLHHEGAAATAASAAVTLEVRALPLGDVLLETTGPAARPLLLVERKALPDLLSSITDGRYAEQSFRLARHPQISPHNVVYLLEGSIAALPRAADRRRCFSVLASCQFFKGFSVCRSESVEDSAQYLVAAAAKIARDLSAGKSPAVGASGGGPSPPTPAAAPADYASVVHMVKKENLTAANIGAVFLGQLPGFSAATAQRVMDAVPGRSVRALLEELGSQEGRDRLRALVVAADGGRRLGPAAVARMCAFLRPDVDPAADARRGGRAAVRKKAAAATTAAEQPKRKRKSAASPAETAAKEGGEGGKRRSVAATAVKRSRTTGGSSVFPDDDLDG